MRFLTWLLVASVLFRSLIPAGYMPSASDKEHFFNIVICTGTGAQTIAVDDSGQPVKQDHSEHQKQTDHKATCPFALNAHALTPADPLAGLSTPADYAALLFTAPTEHPATATLRKTAPPRAPPVFS
jgi:hypothetical protein